MRTYPEYKDSGVEWIGEIPSEWGKTKLKFLNEIIFSGKWGVEPEHNQSEGLFRIIRVSEFDYDKLRVKSEIPTVRSLDIDPNCENTVRYGDLILEKSGGGEKTPVGRLVMVDHEINSPTANSNFTNLIRLNLKYNDSRFITYLYHTCYKFGVTRRNVKQTTGIQNLFLYGLFNETIFVPPLPEQKQISDYLDRKTQKIDDLIEKTERKIELLKEQRSSLINQCVTKGLDPNVEMKDSGVEWIGEIPEGWDIIPLRYNTEKIGSGVTPRGGSEVYSETGIPFLRSQNIHFRGLVLEDVVYISQEIHEDMSGSKVQSGDVLINITGGSIGRCCYIEDSTEYNLSQHVCIVRPQKHLGTSYLYYFLCSEFGQFQVNLNITGSGREGLNFENLGNFSVPKVPLSEQKQISDYLDHETSKIDQMVDTETKRIELLKEYRQSLISNVVTGKIDVRDEVIQ